MSAATRNRALRILRVPAAWVAAPQDDEDADTAFLPALRAAFEAVNGRASSFTLDEQHAMSAAEDAEKRLDRLGVPLSLRAGTTITRASAGPKAVSYSHAAIGTAFTLTRSKSGDWLLTDLKRVEVWPQHRGTSFMRISLAAREAAIRNHLRGVLLHEEEEAAINAPMIWP